jgi:hypothetical protein
VALHECCVSKIALQRWTFAKICFTVAVQMNGFGCLSFSSRYHSRAGSHCFTLAEGSTADAFVRELAKPALHQIGPRGTGGCEVKLKSAVFGQPVLHLQMLVGSDGDGAACILPPRSPREHAGQRTGSWWRCAYSRATSFRSGLSSTCRPFRSLVP